MTSEAQNGTSVVGRDDNESKDALQLIVDDNMRTDVLGPNFCKVLDEHKPTGKKINALIAEAIEQEPTVKAAIAVVLGDLDNKRKGKWVDRLIGAGGAVLLAVAIAAVTKYLFK